MCTTLILDTPNFTIFFILECDASGYVIGPVLMQEGRFVSFERNQCKGKKLVKPIYEK
jgi:hypothetical protein